MKTAAVVTLGCSKNRVDSEHLMYLLKKGGYQTTDSFGRFEDRIDALLINTCGFIADASAESIDAIFEAVEAKKAGSVQKVYVFGCLSGRYRDALTTEFPQVDGFFKANDILSVAEALGVSVADGFDYRRVITTPAHYAYLKMGEGCHRRCSYCAIPLIRGPYVSRPMESLLDEARFLVQSGVKELILVAQDSSYYGMDLYGKRQLATLMEALCQLDGLEWIRVLYTYPQGFPLDVLALMAHEPKICQYVDIPLQHISDKVLTAMRRNTTEAQTRRLIEQFRTRVPGICLRTTLMVGHPGEDTQAFRQLVSFVKEAAFERMGAFIYSEEEGTYAAKHLADNVSPRTKKARFRRLMEVQQEISLAYNQSRLGKTYRVLIDRVDADGAQGRTMYEAPEVDGLVVLPHALDVHPGQFVQATIDRVDEYDLYAHVTL